MKQLTIFLLSACLAGSTLSAYSQSPVAKDLYGQNVLTPEGKKINYSQAEMNALKSARIGENVPVKTATADQTAGIKTPIDAKVDNLYSIMGTCIGRNSMHSVDIDKDGNMELICTASNQNYGTGNFWYIMRYNATDKSYSQIWTSSVYDAGITTLEVVDFNADGNLEILLGFDNGRIEIYDPLTMKLIKSANPVKEPIRSIVYADADNDLTREIVISCTDHTYLLDATTLVVKYTISQGAGNVRVGVLDSSNKNEIVLSSGYIYKLDSAALTTEWRFNTSGDGLVELSDIDQDSKQEVVFAEPWSNIYVYDVDTKTTKYNIKTALEIQALLLTDVNNDGIDEIIYGDGQWGSVFCFNAVTHTKIWSVANPEHGVSAINYADLDKDGTKELIWGAGWTSTGADYLYVWSVGQNKLLWRSDDIVGPFYAVASGDVDGDGKDEIVAVSYESVSGYEGGILVIIDAQTNQLKWKSDSKFFTGIFSGLYNVSVSDLDHDGKSEIIVAADQYYDGSIWIIDGKTHTVKSSYQFSTEKISGFRSLKISDIDNDGQEELLAASGTNLYVIRPSDWAVLWSVPISNDYSTPGIECGDINGDSLKEIIVCKSTIQIINPVDHSYWTSINNNYINTDLFDVNGDGITDLVASTSDGHIVVIDGKSKAEISNLIPESASIASVRVFKRNSTIYYIYSCNNRINIYQDASNCSVSQSFGMHTGEAQSLKLYNQQAISTEILFGTSISVKRMYLNVLSASTTNLTVTAPANSTKTFDISATTAWSVTNDQTWLSLSSVSGTGNGTITVTAQANESVVKRIASLTVSNLGSNSQVITVTQDGAAPVMNLSDKTLTIGAETGSTKTFTITSNMDWTALSSDYWLSTGKYYGTGNSAITLTADGNPYTSARTATITISGTTGTPQTITVTQEAGAAALSVSTNNLFVFAPANDSGAFTIYSNIGWTVASDQAWLKLSSYNGNYFSVINLIVQANPFIETRTATITVSGAGVSTQILTVTQDGQMANLIVSTNSTTIGAAANSKNTINIASNVDWTAASSQSWLTLSPAVGSKNGAIILLAESNSATQTREALVTVSGGGVTAQTIRVTQDAGAALLAVSVNTLVISKSTVTATFEVISNTTWTITSNQTWLTASMESGSGSAGITLTAEPNHIDVMRAASVIVSGMGVLPQAITVLQDALSEVELIEVNSLDLFPNPATNELTVRNASVNDVITVYDLNGNLLISNTAVSSTTKIDVSSLSSGVYSVKLTNERMNRTAKFIKR